MLQKYKELFTTYIYLLSFYIFASIIFIKIISNHNLYINYKYVLNPIQIDKGLYIISSYLENQKIRILSYIELDYNNSKNINCLFKLQNIHFSKIKIIKYPGVHKKYCNIFCDIPNSIKYNFQLYLSNKQISVSKFIKLKKYELIFCLTTLFNYNNTHRFLEFIEYYRNFGVEKFVIYNTNCSNRIEKVLAFYSQLGLVDIILDNLTHNLYENKRFHVWKQNDCFFRYKYSSKKIIFTDHDEIIYSPVYKESSLFLHLNNKASIYYFYPKLTITNGKGFFHEGNYSVCPNSRWKFIINKPDCISQVVVHDVILKNNKICFKQTIPVEKGYVLHARNEKSRHSKVCKEWYYESEMGIDRNILQKRVKYIKNKFKKIYSVNNIII